MPDPKEHAAKRNALESLLRSVPGFQGYLEREYRRESDELLRNWLADRLQRSRRAIDDVSRQLADAAQIEILPQIDRLRARLDRLIGRIRGAMQGYSGLFDLVRIDTPQLDDVYQHDAALNQKVDELVQAAQQLPRQQDQLSTAIAEMLGRIDQLELRWDAREDMLKGLGVAEQG